MAMSLLFVCFCLLSPFTLAAQIVWTGAAGDSLWASGKNWLGNNVPTSADDVVINVLGGANVQISSAAQANSVTIAGGQYAQSLILLNSLALGAGGMTVESGGTLNVQNNNDLPLTSQGNVVVESGGTFIFQSGAITGPGEYVISGGATITFDQAALKLISAANLTIWGTGTVQASTIEVEKSGLFNNQGNLTVIGGVNIFSQDNTGQFNNWGDFNYVGAAGIVLNLQLTTNFYSDLNVDAGSLTIDDTFVSNATVNIPQGGVLTVAAGTSTKQFNMIKGNGELLVEGIAIVNEPISSLTFEVTDSGSLTFNGAASFGAAWIRGTVNAMAAVAINNLTLAGGNLTGPGTISVANELWITTSDTGNTNNFLSATLVLYGAGQSTEPIYLLLGGNGGQFHIAAGATYDILNTFSFGVQDGKPQFIVDGTLSVTTSGTITTNVDITGAGAIKLNSGSLVANGDTFTIGQLFLASGVTATLNTVVLTATSVSGSGLLNLTAAPAPVSTVQTVSLDYFGLVNGVANVGSFAVTTFDIWAGAVNLGASSANTASTVNIYGGSLIGAAMITTTDLNLDLSLPAILNGVAVKTSTLTILSQGTGNIQLSNGATIIADSSSLKTRSSIRGGVAIN